MFLKLQYNMLSTETIVQIVLGSIILLISADLLFIEDQPSLIPQFLKDQFNDEEDDNTIDMDNFDIDSIFDEPSKKQNNDGQQHYYPEQLGFPVQQEPSCDVSRNNDHMSRFSEPLQQSSAGNPLMNSYMQMY
jgi:hypothetical protein